MIEWAIRRKRQRRRQQKRQQRGSSSTWGQHMGARKGEEI